jgi:hypothetical protein
MFIVLIHPRNTILTTCFPLRVEMSAAASKLQHRASINDVGMTFISVSCVPVVCKVVQGNTVISIKLDQNLST